MSSHPLFVLGAPRSGTTFLCHTLNQHPSISLTNESRVFVLLKDLVEARCSRPDLLDQHLRPAFQAFVKRHAGQLVERFYREELGIAAPFWGDKHTTYGDPAALSGRSGPAVLEPRSGSCLRLIRECLPTARFIHLHRHPWRVAASMATLGWVSSIQAGLQVWRQHVGEIEGFFAEIASEQHLTLSYAELVNAPTDIATQLGQFLGLGSCEPVARFLRGQRDAPTPFSTPTSDLRTQRFADRQHAIKSCLSSVADMADLLGYQQHADLNRSGEAATS